MKFLKLLAFVALLGGVVGATAASATGVSVDQLAMDGQSTCVLRANGEIKCVGGEFGFKLT